MAKGGDLIKALGVVRRLDDLGRLVIPKEIRRAQNWPSGTPMEFFMSEDGLVLKKYQTSDGLEADLLKELNLAAKTTMEPETFEVLQKVIGHLKK